MTIKIEQRVRILKGQHAGELGIVKDLLPYAIGVELDGRLRWFSGADLEPALEAS